jgi:hypothetical protein
MDLGKEYLLFLSTDKLNNAFFVDSCGNSGLLSKSGATLQLLDQTAT